MNKAVASIPGITEEIHSGIKTLFGKMDALRVKINKIGGSASTTGDEPTKGNANPQQTLIDVLSSANYGLQKLNKEFEEQLIRLDGMIG